MILLNSSQSPKKGTKRKGETVKSKGTDSAGESPEAQKSKFRKSKGTVPKKIMFSWELTSDPLAIEPAKLYQTKSQVHRNIGYILTLSALIGFILAGLLIILPHQVSSLTRAVVGLTFEIYYSSSIFIIILSCLILWSANHALKKNSFPWVVVGCGFCLIVAGLAAFVFNLHDIGTIFLNLSVLILIIIESILGALSLILTMSSRFIFDSELRF